MSASAQKRLEKQARARQTVKRVSSGGGVESTARALNVTRRTIHRDLTDPSTQALIGRHVAEQEADLHRIYGKALARVDLALDATTLEFAGTDENGKDQWEEAPDHDKRLEAVQRFCDLTELLMRYGP
jgi:hypothetical protein